MDGSGIQIRLLNPSDADLLRDVAEDVFDGPILRDRLVAFLSDASHALVVALDGDRVIGQIQAMVHRRPDRPDELYVDNLGVSPAHRRLGVGRALLEAALDWGRERGCTGAWVVTERENALARGLYAGFGFEEETIASFARAL